MSARNASILVITPLIGYFSTFIARTLALQGNIEDAEREIDPDIDRFADATGLLKFHALHFAGAVKRLAGIWAVAEDLQRAASALTKRPSLASIAGHVTTGLNIASRRSPRLAGVGTGLALLPVSLLFPAALPGGDAAAFRLFLPVLAGEALACATAGDRQAGRRYDGSAYKPERCSCFPSHGPLRKSS
ncbi:MAG: hypothetical protein OEW68_16665 [Gammaproteobacteria bacterium]|nr:hypothetical protein [Gammaproteobacteria bacterium]MDH4316451.1 hypothetical protein [Gammaproteobacteria bacterium]MDH5215668.1 hypothetical protein [Gammaproteobacteria bacterium]